MRARRRALRAGQSPFAGILGCSDSRVPPELIFDLGLGDLFVIRVAGNSTGRAVLGSMEYAVSHLGVPLIVVLGHSDCGAVKASLSSGDETRGHLRHITAAIQPALNLVDNSGIDAINAAAKTHARRIAREMRTSSPIIAESHEEGMLNVVAAYYSIETGKVEVLDGNKSCKDT